MKKTIIAVVLISLFAFAPSEKKLKVELSQAEWVKILNKFQVVRQIADNSDLPHQQVKFINLTLDSVELAFIPQLRIQLDTTKKK